MSEELISTKHKRQNGDTIDLQQTLDESYFVTPNGIKIRNYIGFEFKDLEFNNKDDVDFKSISKKEIELYSKLGFSKEHIKIEQDLCDAYVNIVEKAKITLDKKNADGVIDELKNMRESFARKQLILLNVIENLKNI